MEVYIRFENRSIEKCIIQNDVLNPEEYLADLNLYFKKLDKNGFWKNFKWDELKIKYNKIN